MLRQYAARASNPRQMSSAFDADRARSITLSIQLVKARTLPRIMPADLAKLELLSAKPNEARLMTIVSSAMGVSRLLCRDSVKVFVALALAELQSPCASRSSQ